ncbi:ABC transporter substrate-binding protein [Actinocorallia sp. A-T 12471]|uniref:ABC transporter substrate-binding protein n=1 Tax=Actinocorallia sp. A-T 12471 TaxID=3089813 RepID=UPI0029CB455D|nr:ABC transporter substrate-binding protein [Actinocorallia sp. A-T 12471]MDX6739275.1 ABC transporter substrate-binding protein [Actinocorallia sp. A-T 12471]
MRRARALGAVLLFLPLAAGCGFSTSSGSAEGTGEAVAPITVEAANGTVTLPGPAERIVSLSPTTTEMLFAIGANEQVVAVDDYSTYPAEAPRTDLSGFKPNAEAIAAYKPDLVVLSDDMDGIIAALGKLKIPVIHEPAAKVLDDSYDQITDLGAATGKGAEAAVVVKTMKDRIDAAVKAVPDGSGITYFHEVTTDLYTITSKTFLGQIYGLFGLENIADEADKQGTGYPQLSAEAVLKADPRLIFLADARGAGQSAETVAKRAGWSGLTAVKEQGVVALDDDIASRWGPRLPDLIEDISAAVKQAAA